MTKKGRDLLAATAAALVVAGVVGPAISAAFSLAISFVAALSILLLSSNIRRIEIDPRPKSLRIFKHEAASTLVFLQSGSLDWMRPSSLSLDSVEGFEGRVGQVGPRSFEMVIEPRYAGTFVVSSATLVARDALGAFLSERRVPVDLRVESLPLALLAPDRPLVFSPMRVGENPAGRKGTGQELYAVEEYHQEADPKDILWKRVARAEDGSIPVRTRESNLRTSITLGLDLGWETDADRTRRVDLALEAIAQIGRLLLSLGTAVEVLYQKDLRRSRSRAANTTELAELLVRVSEASPNRGDAADAAPACDLLLVTPDRNEGPRTRGATPRVVLADGASPPEVPGQQYAFTGIEDLSPLTMLVLDR